MNLNATFVVALLAGGFASIWLVVMGAVRMLRWVRKNRAEASAMMTGTYLEQVAGGAIAPPDQDFTDWLGHVVDSLSEPSPGHDHGHAQITDLTVEPTHHSSAPEGYSAQ